MRGFPDDGEDDEDENGMRITGRNYVDTTCTNNSYGTGMIVCNLWCIVIGSVGS